MTNIFFQRPGLLVHETKVMRTRQTGCGRVAVAVAENIIRPGGGGQPQDRGEVRLHDDTLTVGEVFKADGATWITLDMRPAREPLPGDTIELRVEQRYRKRVSECHTAVHLLMAAVRNVVRGYESKGASIAENACDIELRFSSEEAVTPDLLSQIDVLARHLMARAIPVVIDGVRSMKEAEARYRQWRVDPNLSLSGKIRVVHILGVDANPCSGSHVPTTAQIGPFIIGHHRVDGRGVNVLAVEKSDVWTKWYGDGALAMCTRVDLGKFDI